MIAALLKAKVRPGKKDKFLEFLKWDCQVARDEEEGTLRWDVFEDPNDDSVVFFYEAYVDQAAFEARKLGEPLKAFIGGLREECTESIEAIIPGWTTAYCTTAE